MRVIESVREMQATCMRLVRERKSIRLVPTMGALHAGHGSLIRRALEDDSEPGAADDNDANENIDVRVQSRLPSNCVTNGNQGCWPRDQSTGCARMSVVVVSIFVNPSQFNDPADLAKYPRTRDSDLAICQELNVDFVFMPKAEEIYGSRSPGCHDELAYELRAPRETCEKPEMVTLRPPERLARDLEGRSRAGHFEGMLTIVNKLFNIVRPERAYFGEKDYQQLVLVRAMSEDLNMQVRVCPVETKREQDTGLPLSSRNVRLTLDQRRLAAQMMSEVLFSTAQVLEDKCRRGAARIDLDATLLASQLTSQLMLDLREEDITDHLYREERHSAIDAPASGLATDYFELRCARDLTVIKYDETKRLYDCQRGCCDRAGDSNCGSRGNVLDARLLMSILVAKVRLLDNVGVRLNLPGGVQR